MSIRKRAYEHPLTVLEKALEVHKRFRILIWLNDGQFPELDCERPTGKNALNDIRAIETVHAVGANNRRL